MRNTYTETRMNSAVMSNVRFCMFPCTWDVNANNHFKRKTTNSVKITTTNPIEIQTMRAKVINQFSAYAPVRLNLFVY